MKKIIFFLLIATVVFGQRIRPSEVKGYMLEDSTITADKIATGVITSANVADSSITSAKIATAAVTVADTTALKALTESRTGFNVLVQSTNVLYVQIDSTYTENGSGVAFNSVTTGKQWVALEYLAGNYVDVKWSGAPSDKSDVTAYFNRVKSFLSTHGGKMIISANTNYALEDFTPYAGMIIEGQTNISYNLSTKQARLYPASDNGAIIKKVSGVISNVTIKNINFEGINSATGDTAKYGIYVNGGYEWKIEGNNFDYFSSAEGSYCVWTNQVNNFTFIANDYYRSDVCTYDSLGDGNYYMKDRYISYGIDGARSINTRNIVFNGCNWNLDGSTFDDNSNGLTLRNAWGVSVYSPYVEIDGGNPTWFNIIQHGRPSPVRGNITALNVYDVHATSSTAELLGKFNSHEQAIVNMFGGNVVFGGMDSIFIDVKDTVTYVCNVKNLYAGTAGGNSQRLIDKSPLNNDNWDYGDLLSFNEWRINYSPETTLGSKNYGVNIFARELRTARMSFENTSANHGNYSARVIDYRVSPITNVTPATDSLVKLQIIHQTSQTRYNHTTAINIDYWLGHPTSSSGGEIRQELGYYISKAGGANHTGLDTIKTWHSYLPGAGTNDFDSIKVVSQNADTSIIGFWLNSGYASSMYFQCLLSGDNIGTATATKVSR